MNALPPHLLTVLRRIKSYLYLKNSLKAFLSLLSSSCKNVTESRVAISQNFKFMPLSCQKPDWTSFTVFQTQYDIIFKYKSKIYI